MALQSIEVHWRTSGHSFDKRGSNGNIMFILMYLSVRDRYYHHKGSPYLTEPNLFLPLCLVSECDRFSVWQTFKFLTILFGANLQHLQTTELSRWGSCYKLTQRQMKLFTAFSVLFLGLLHVQLGYSCSPTSLPEPRRPQPTCNHTK